MGGRLEGKVAVVTGGANGIGRACCERFAREGARVLVADLLDDPGRETASAVDGEFVHLDASSPADNDAMISTALERFGRIDVLVTAAGISHGEYRSGDVDIEREMIAERIGRIGEPGLALLDLDLEGWRRVLDVNLTGTLLAIRAAAKPMIDAKGGSIVTIASIAAKRPEAGPIAYATSKAGVWMLTKSAARDLAPAGIRVNAIGPGYIETNMTAALSEMPELWNLLQMQIPLARPGKPEEVASCALFLASDDASYVTGELLHPDGGFFTD